MGLYRMKAGERAPQVVNVIIEIPALSDPIKYEVDKETGALVVDRFMTAAMHYPCNYGYVPDTLAEDGDPVDVLVITPYPLLSGSVIPARPIGVLEMSDEAGRDSKVVAVPDDKLSTQYRHIKDVDDLDEQTRAVIAHFFEHYKDLEKGKWVKVDGWEDAAQARQVIQESLDRA